MIGLGSDNYDEVCADVENTLKCTRYPARKGLPAVDRLWPRDDNTMITFRNFVHPYQIALKHRYLVKILYCL